MGLSAEDPQELVRVDTDDVGARVDDGVGLVVGRDDAVVAPWSELAETDLA